jgi:hypothetical protein
MKNTQKKEASKVHQDIIYNVKNDVNIFFINFFMCIVILCSIMHYIMFDNNMNDATAIYYMNKNLMYVTL